MTDAPKSPVYIYRSPFGALTIRRALTDASAWFLTYETRARASNGEMVVTVNGLTEGWSTPEAVADRVLRQQSGWEFWDTLPEVCFPASLDDWQAVDPYGSALPNG